MGKEGGESGKSDKKGARGTLRDVGRAKQTGKKCTLRKHHKKGETGEETQVMMDRRTISEPGRSTWMHLREH